MPNNITAMITNTKPGCGRLLGWFCFALGAITTAGLIVVFKIVGDLTVLGEAITAFPPVLYLFPLALLFLPVIFTRSWKAGLISAICLIAFVLSTEDWFSLIRTIRLNDSPNGIRVVTLNIDSRADWETLLGELEPYKPDILFLQETPDGANSLTTRSLSGYWKGFSCHDQGDCAIVSRYPLHTIESDKIGPWDKPALARIVVPSIDKDRVSTGGILLCNVRLMLPAIATSPDMWLTDYATWPESHRLRIDQIHKLVALIDNKNLNKCVGCYESLILGGDFKTRGGSKSLAPLDKLHLKDTWTKAGTGWGATIVSSFPVARIDQIWTTSDWKAILSRTIRISNIDHRGVLTVLAK